MLKRVFSVVLVSTMLFQLTACSFVDTTQKAASLTKKAIVSWYNSIDMSSFKKGWDTAVGFAGTAYSATLSNEYVNNIGKAISNLKDSMNSAAGSTRGIAQEAGFAAEKWIAGTFNIDSAARESSYHAEVVGSNELGSADVSTNFGVNASLKYYQSGSESAHAQAKAFIDAYSQYVHKSSNPMTLEEYMDSHGYDYHSQHDLMASIYDNQIRIIPADQVDEAIKYLNGKIDKLSSIDGDVASARTQAYQETLSNLRDSLNAPDGTSATPATYKEMQAIAELSETGEFRPEDFGISLSKIITPQYLIKQAIGTGIEAGLLKTVFTVGPDIVSILIEAVKSNEIDENVLKNVGIESAIAMSSGFVEGSLSHTVVTLCKKGALGENLKEAPPNVVGTLVFLVVEAIISGYSLANGEITAEEYGWAMADKILTAVLAIPSSTLLLSMLPGTKLFILAGTFAGSVIASTGYTHIKEVALEFVDSGGFEAFLPRNVGTKIPSVNRIVAKLNLSGHLSNMKQFAIDTMDNGSILVKRLVG